MKQRAKSIVVLFLCIFLTACSTSPAESMLSAIPALPKTNTATPTFIPTSTATSAPTPTLVSTLTAAKKKILAIELLSSTKNSELPSLWGLEPGETEMETALQFFYNLGWGIGRYSGPLGDVYPTGIETDDLSIRIDLFGIDETLKASSFLLTHPILDGRDQWLSVQNILDEYGVPDQIWVELHLGAVDLDTISRTGFDVYLFFKEPLFLMKYSGITFREKDTFKICLLPATSADNGKVSYINNVLIFFGSSKMGTTPQELVRPFWVFLAKTTIEEAFAMSPQDMYDQIMINQNLCFLTLDEIWKR